MKKIVLIGDSIFDNAAYVERGRSVTDHLERMLPADVSPIEPSAQGAGKIADRIAYVFRDCPSFVEHTVIY